MFHGVIPHCVAFLLVSRVQMLAGELGVPAARPRLEPDSRALCSLSLRSAGEEPPKNCSFSGKPERNVQQNGNFF